MHCVWCESRSLSCTECSCVSEGHLVYIVEYPCHCMETLTPAYSEASHFGMFVLWLTRREQISTSCRMLKHGNIPLREQSLLIYLEDAAACAAGKTSVHQGLMLEEIIHTFWSLHQYFYLIRSFLHRTAAESGNGCSDCCMDSSFTILPQEKRESLYILPAWRGAPRLLL